jgi:hypothetical protein
MYRAPRVRGTTRRSIATGVACRLIRHSPRLGQVHERAGIGGVVAALSVASDLTRGHPPGEAMRACLLATELARRAGLDRVRQGEVYYGTLLRFAGCAATSHEIAAAFGGDDIIVRARGDLIDPTEPEEAVRFLAGLGVGGERLRTLGGAAGVARLKAEGARADCEVGAGLAGPCGCRRQWASPFWTPSSASTATAYRPAGPVMRSPRRHGSRPSAMR